jgi:hypothetical protein
MEFNLEKPTADEITRHFSAAMDSVSLIAELTKKETLTDAEKDAISRNKEHLKIMISRDWFTAEQKQALQAVL